MKLKFSRQFRKILKYQISWKSVQWELSCSKRTDRLTDRQTDRQTDMTKLIVAFRNFKKAPKTDSGFKTNLFVSPNALLLSNGDIQSFTLLILMGSGYIPFPVMFILQSFAYLISYENYHGICCVEP